MQSATRQRATQQCATRQCTVRQCATQQCATRQCATRSYYVPEVVTHHVAFVRHVGMLITEARRVVQVVALFFLDVNGRSRGARADAPTGDG